MSDDTEEPKKPTETKKSMGAPAAPSSSQPAQKQSGEGLENVVKKLEEIRTADQTQRAELKTAIDDLAGSIEKDSKDKPTKEEETEKQNRLSKLFGALGDTFKKAFSGFKGLGKLLSGSLGPLKKFWDAVKKVKGFILAFLGVFLLKTFTIKDVKEMWEGMKKFFLETKKLFITIMEFMEPIIDWFKKKFAPATFQLFMDTIDNLTASFAQLTADFKDFTSKGWQGKLKAIISALGTVGTFVTTFFGDVVDWTFRLLGYEGSVTKDLRNWLSNIFGPDLMGKFSTIFTTVIGAMAVARVFGMSPIKFMAIAGKMIWGSIRALFAVVRLALSPIGLGLTLAALTVAFSKEIVRSIENTVGQLITGFKNLFIDLNNSIADTAIGKMIGVKKKDRLVWDKKAEAQKYEGERKKEIADLQAQNAKMKEIKEKSGYQSGVAELQQKYGKDVKLWVEKKEGWIWDTVDDREALMTKNQHMLDKKQKDLKEFQYNWSEELGVEDAQSPYTGEGTLIGGVVQKGKDLVGAGMGMMDDAREEGVSLKSTAPDMTKLFEGFGKAGRPGFAYNDTLGNRTIGYGFNMDKTNAEKIMKAAGISKDWNDLRAGKIALTKEEGRKLKDYEMEYFRDSAKNWIGSDKWSKMNVGAQNALTDMAYNMGGEFTGKHADGAFKWKDLRTALRSEDMAGVGPAMQDSNWFKQVGSERSGYNIAALSNAYAVPSSMGDLSPSKERMAQQDSMMTQHNNITTNEGDSHLHTNQKSRQGDPNLMATVTTDGNPLLPS